MMLILDTDHLSIVSQDTIEAFNIGRRLASVPSSEVCVTIITYEEQMRGWLAYIAQAKSPARQLEAYRRLRQFVERYREVALLDYASEAAVQLEKLQQDRVRIGTMDLKIAAICLANNAMLLSRNLKDFGQVPGLIVEDWSQ